MSLAYGLVGAMKGYDWGSRVRKDWDQKELDKIENAGLATIGTQVAPVEEVTIPQDGGVAAPAAPVSPGRTISEEEGYANAAAGLRAAGAGRRALELEREREDVTEKRAERRVTGKERQVKEAGLDDSIANIPNQLALSAQKREIEAREAQKQLFGYFYKEVLGGDEARIEDFVNSPGTRALFPTIQKLSNGQRVGVAQSEDGQLILTTKDGGKELGRIGVEQIKSWAGIEADAPKITTVGDGGMAILTDNQGRVIDKIENPKTPTDDPAAKRRTAAELSVQKAADWARENLKLGDTQFTQLDEGEVARRQEIHRVFTGLAQREITRGGQPDLEGLMRRAVAQVDDDITRKKATTAVRGEGGAPGLGAGLGLW